MTRANSTVRTLALAAGLTLAPAAALAQGDDALLPIREITLYRSGVGAFARQGLIDGSATVSLRFDAEQINDILKSMVVLDLDGGDIGAVSYSSREPLERRLAGFGVNIADDPSVHELFGRLRGSRVTLELTGDELSGTILGVEHRKVPESVGGGETMHLWHVNLVTEKGIRTVLINDIRSFEFEDEQVATDLARALAALAEHRADTVKSVDLSFSGPEGAARRAMVAYVHEMPVWKTSYRLVLPDPAAGGEPTIQGWAIVENTTDHDWEDVSLSLASGRPVSFTMDLYEPLFAPRPDVPVPFLAALAPKVYESPRSLGRAHAFRGEQARMGIGEQTEEANASLAVRGTVALSYDDAGAAMGDYLGQAQASAGTVGEQFFYTLDQPVNLERQRSAMLPILSSPIEGRRVSIYNIGAGQPNPMRGIELDNTSGLTLMPGPIAVYDASAYAGDAQIPHTSRGQKRLLSYAVDLDVEVDTDRGSDQTVRQIRIVDGYVRHTISRERTTAYVVTNNDETKRRTVLIEQPMLSGWDLVEPTSPHEITENLYRFEVDVPAGDGAELRVVERSVTSQSYSIADYDAEWLVRYQRDGKMSPAVAKVIGQAAEMHAEINQIEALIEDLARQQNEITADQDRLRRNMGSVDRNSDLYARYLRKLSEQEDRMEALTASLDGSRKQLAWKQEELRRFIRDLDVE